MNKNISFVLLLLFTLTSCIQTYKNISISENNTTKITYNKICPIIDSTSGIEYEVFNEITAIVENIDSLGNHMQVLGKEFYIFNYDSNSFKLKISDDTIFNKTPYYRSIPKSIKWEFPKKIINVSGQGKVYLHRNSRTLVIYKSKSNYITSDEKVDITVSFEHDSIGSQIKHPIGFKRVGYAIDPLPGVGLTNVNGAARTYLNGTYFMNWGFSTFIFNRVRFVPRLAIMNGKTNGKLKDLEAYTHFENTNLEFGIGYELLNNPYINITPIMYGGVNKLDFYVEDESFVSVSRNGGFKYSVGTTIDLKIDPIFRSKEKRKSKKNEYFYIKVDAGWYPNYFKKSLTLEGSVSYLTFAIGGYISVDNNFRRVILKNK